MKHHRGNSCIYAFEKKYILAKKIGISVNTFSSYLEYCLKKGYAVKKGDTIQFIKLIKIITDIFGYKRLNSYRHVRFFKHCATEDMNVSSIYEKIKWEMAKLNFNQQQWHNDRLQKAYDLSQNCQKQKSVRFIQKIARKYYGTSSIEDFKSICDKKKFIVRTGKCHVSKILGSSTQTGARLLKLWTKDGFITREIVRKFYKVFLDEELEDILETRYTHVLPCSSGYQCTLGSIVSVVLSEDIGVQG